MSIPHPPTLGASPATPEAIIVRLQRDARDDPRLAAIPATTRDQSIERAVQELWATSRVKTFLPVLALRQARAALDGLGAPAAADAQDPAGAPPRHAASSGCRRGR